MVDKNLAVDFDTLIPTGDDKPRSICRHCAFVDYKNPKIVAGAVVYKKNKVLLCKRAISPRQHYWTLPAGYMEMGESIEDAARREAREEAKIDISLEGLLATYSVPRIGQVHMMYVASLKSDFAPGLESEAVALFDWHDVPWRYLAFPTVVWALSHFAAYRTDISRAPFTNPPNTHTVTYDD